MKKITRRQKNASQEVEGAPSSLSPSLAIPPGASLLLYHSKDYYSFQVQSCSIFYYLILTIIGYRERNKTQKRTIIFKCHILIQIGKFYSQRSSVVGI